MKKTLFAFMALAATFATTSCQSDEEFAQQPTGKPMVINAVAEGIGTGTKATMAYKYDILWSEGDEIYVKNSASNATFTLKSGQGTTNGTFECNESPFVSGTEVEAFYPASLIHSDGSYLWPAEQGTSTVVPMYSKKTLGDTSDEKFSFVSLGAVLQIVFTTPQADVTLKSITIKDDNATMSGTFTVDENGKAGITATDKAGITLDLGETGKALGKGANFFNIAVPAGTYSKLNITFTTTDSSTCTLKGSVTIKHNTVGRLVLTGTKFIPASPAGSTGTATRTGGIEVKWVQLWENGPKFAEYNVGVTDGKAESYGGYYTWGGNVDKGTTYVSGTAALTGDNDTATKLWGDNWRMPTKTDFENLLAKCDVKWIDGNTDITNGTTEAGLLCTGKGAYEANSVFLPAVGYCYSDNVRGQGSGNYWSSTPYGSNDAYDLYFDSGGQCEGSDYRYHGFSVRAVLKETPATTGTATATIGGSEVNVNWIQLWAGGPKFAEYNVGVTDGKAESYGGYYTWGGNVDKDSRGSYNSGTDALTGTDDTATKLWGSNWRMPTRTEFVGLIAYCDVEWTTVNNVNGRKFTGKGDYSCNSVFLPAAGRCYAYSSTVSGPGTFGWYWSSTPSGGVYACDLYFHSGELRVNSDGRTTGHSVRAVLAE